MAARASRPELSFANKTGSWCCSRTSVMSLPGRTREMALKDLGSRPSSASIRPRAPAWPSHHLAEPVSSSGEQA